MKPTNQSADLMAHQMNAPDDPEEHEPEVDGPSLRDTRLDDDPFGRAVEDDLPQPTGMLRGRGRRHVYRHAPPRTHAS